MPPFRNYSKGTARELLPGFRGKFEHGNNMTIGFWEIDKDAKLPEHSHEHEQIATVYQGRFELTIDGESRVLEPGMTAVIPSNAVHSGRALTDCQLTDVFSPVREDYRFE